MIFSKVDLIPGYHQIPVASKMYQRPPSQPPSDDEFLHMPFGLCNARQKFQQLMDHMIWGLDGFFMYMDDILITSASIPDHLHHLWVLFLCLQEHVLIVCPKKCQFGHPQLHFLGHALDSSSINPLPSRVATASRFLLPTTVRQLWQFLGLVKFYHCSLPGAGGNHYNHSMSSVEHALHAHYNGFLIPKLHFQMPRHFSHLQPPSHTHTPCPTQNLL